MTISNSTQFCSSLQLSTHINDIINMNEVKFEPKTEGYEPRDRKGQKQGGNNNNNKRRNNRSKKGRSSSSAFRGEHKDLQGYVYVYDTSARPNQYEKTTARIGPWVKQELDHSLDSWNAMLKVQEPDIAT